MFNKIKKFVVDYLAWLIVAGVAALCAIFILCGKPSENGSITLDGKNAQIEEYTEKFIENSNDALNRIMNEDAPTDEETIKANDEPVGLGAYTTLDDVKARRLPDGDTDGGKGWQCSKYTAYLATGQRQYSTAHPDYGPVNGKDVVDWLVRTKGWKRIDQPVEGAIGSGGFNTKYGHTAEFLYWVAPNVAMVSDANYVPLTVATHTINVSGWIWAVPGDYVPEPTPTPTPTPTPQPTPTPATTSYTVRKGDTLGGIARKMGWCNGCVLFGDNGYTQKMAEYNGIPNRGLIYPGQVIRKP